KVPIFNMLPYKRRSIEYNKKKDFLLAEDSKPYLAITSAKKQKVLTIFSLPLEDKEGPIGFPGTSCTFISYLRAVPYNEMI
ncbi:hypothetical protein ACJX0J_037143, partial [Zea mays]